MYALPDMIPFYIYPGLRLAGAGISSFISLTKLMEITLRRYGVPGWKMVHIPIGVDTALFQPDVGERAAVRRSMGIDAQRPVVLTIARLHPDKGIALLLEAARQVVSQNQEVLFMVVGDGPERERLERLVRESRLESNVLFTGTRSDRERLYKLADIYVMPAIHAAFGMSLLEAMACGLPVVVFREETWQLAVRDGEHGFVVPAYDCGLLAERIIKLLADQRLRDSLGRAARELVRQRYDLRRGAGALGELYTRLASRDYGRARGA
jgi:glycosyltransferase involved in cell wall biosynthesis